MVDWACKKSSINQPILAEYDQRKYNDPGSTNLLGSSLHERENLLKLKVV